MTSQSQRPLPDVEASDLKRHLDALAAEVDPVQGIFGPGSLMWMVGRESVLVLAGGRAALLQLAHPYVAQGVAHHSEVLADVQGRFRRTLSYVYNMTFGDLDSALNLSRRVFALHRRVNGRLEDSAGRYAQGDRYTALDPHALFWVAATLWDTSILIFEKTIRPLSRLEKHRYYQEAKVFARLFAIPDEAIPPDWDAFRRYFDRMLVSSTLAVSPAAKTLAQSVFTAPRPAAEPLFAWMRVFTAGLMPGHLREAFDLPFTPRERAVYAASIRAMKLGLHRLPAPVRFCPAYQNAGRRLRGEEGIDPVSDFMAKGLLTLLDRRT